MARRNPRSTGYVAAKIRANSARRGRRNPGPWWVVVDDREEGSEIVAGPFHDKDDAEEEALQLAAVIEERYAISRQTEGWRGGSRFDEPSVLVEDLAGLRSMGLSPH